MFTTKKYVPLLKGKRAEFNALKLLSSPAKRRITPFIDVPNVKFNKDDLKKAKDKEKEKNRQIKNHLDKVAKNIKEFCNEEIPLVYIDLFDLENPYLSLDKIHSTTYLFNQLKSEQLEIEQVNNKIPYAIPVVGIEKDDKYKVAVKNIMRTEGTGTCIRIQREDIERGMGHLEKEIKKLISFLSVTREETHILFDFRCIIEKEFSYVKRLAIDTLKNINAIDNYKTVIIAGSGYSDDLIEKKVNSITKIKRLELELWRFILLEQKELIHLISLGDYGIVDVDFPEKDFGPFANTTYPKIKYTGNDGLYVFRGESYYHKYGDDESSSVKRTKHYVSQFTELTKRIVKHKCFINKSCCEGDTYIYNCAKNKERVRVDFSSWIGVGTIHHLTAVSEQIASEF